MDSEQLVTECFLWMCHPSGPSPANPKLYEVVANCFENMANALSVVRQLPEEPETLRTEFERSLDLLAEAQSALRVAIDTMDRQPDFDQMLKFNWLRAITSERQVFIERYKEAFGLKDLLWIETREHESFEGFEPHVARPDVAAVLLAIRWASHSYGEVKEFCDRYE